MLGPQFTDKETHREQVIPDKGRELTSGKFTVSPRDVSFWGSGPPSKPQPYESMLHFRDLGSLASTPCISHAASRVSEQKAFQGCHGD